MKIVLIKTIAEEHKEFLVLVYTELIASRNGDSK